MKVNLKFLTLIAGFLFFMTASVSAQKFGYTNSAALLVEMPETSSADAQLKQLQESLTKEIQAKETAFNAEVQKYIEQGNSGMLTPVQMQELEADLQAQQLELQQMSQDAQVKIQQKRDELYSPILEKVQKAIDEVGAANGYDIIFDVAALNVILFADESDDVTELVKAKL
ncbi:MAG: OmpH family outer membrane protein [Bacteroidetes bacterium]|nr:OmpH family outer membrane protein [Bacteroidota bacterium]